MKKSHSIEYYYNKAFKLAINKTENMARRILKQHPNLDEFIIGMGSWSFTRKNGDIEIDTFSPIKYVNNFASLMNKWDELFHITGTPMRFTAKGKKVTDW